MTNPHATPHANTSADDNAPATPKPSLDAIGKQMTLDVTMEYARRLLQLETLETRGRDALDFHEIPVRAIRDLVRRAFEDGYRDGLHSGYRQGRRDASDEAAGRETPSQPRNPELPPTSNPTTT